MNFSKTNETNTGRLMKNYLRSKTFQRILIGILTVLTAFIIIVSGAAPKKYKLNLGEPSQYDIKAPRDIENKIKTEQNRKMAEDAVMPVMKEVGPAYIDVLNAAGDFFTLVETSRKSVEQSLQDQGIGKKDKVYKKQLGIEQDLASGKLANGIKGMGVPLSNEQVFYLVAKASDDNIASFKKSTNELLSAIMREDITQDNLANKVDTVQNNFQKTELSQDLKNIGGLLIKTILKPNKTVDEETTKRRKDDAKVRANIEKIEKGAWIIRSGDEVTQDKLKIIEELNLLDTKDGFDYPFAAGILAILVLLAFILILYMNHFCKKTFQNRNDLILISLIMVLTLLIARFVYEYSVLAIPIFIAAMLISILMDLKLAIVINFLLTIAISFITNGDPAFMYMSMISGTYSAFLVSKVSQRSRLSMSGFVIGGINVIVILCIGIINQSGYQNILKDSMIVFVNGVASIILTIGLLPFWEATFNIITPLKLLELADPNQPLVKRLLMEAPGTYHHSLMVGNLAEVATEAIGGNALLARVGAYFHDVGKLKRPNFFKENQMSDNPHDRMTANLSTLVITSHTQDGVDMAQKHKIPLAIREIINQHHGTTLVAYFYHKARKGEKGEDVKSESFRYDNPKPTSKEAAVVMLADSVEAAVRSMIDKTEGKIEGLVRKIIKDKLDDGQLDQCNLTLKELDSIAKSFMRVLSGLFHEREEYPEIKARPSDLQEIKVVDPIGQDIGQTTVANEGRLTNDNIN